MKELMEKRARLMEQLDALNETAKVEQRAFTEEEDKTFDEITSQIESIDKTIEKMEQSRALVKEIQPEGEIAKTQEEDVELRAFAEYVRSGDSNITKTDNGAVIPKTIANRIIDKIKDISPLFREATRYSVKGTLAIPYVDDSNDNITVAYATEFEDLEAKSTKLLSVDLTGFLAGVLAKVSKSLINSSDIDLVSFVVDKLGVAAAVWIDDQLLNGTNDKIDGLSKATQVVTAASQNAITADELLKLKNKLKSAYQNGAFYVMAPETFTAVQLLKDDNHRYIFDPVPIEGFSGNIFGKPVYVTDQAKALAAGNATVFYLNPAQALAIKMTEESVEILREKYATQHAIGVVEWIEMDAKIQNQQAVAVLKQASAPTG